MNVSHLPGGTLARSVATIQDRVADARVEMVTGRLADPVATLGGGRGRGLAQENDAASLDRIRDGNAITASRLDATAAQLGRMAGASGEMVQTLVGAMSGALDREFLSDAVSTAREQVTQALNATSNGTYLFSGVTSDVRPVRDGSDAAAALEGRFRSAFGFASGDDAAATIAPRDAAAFAADAIDWLTGAGWSLVSDASDDPVKARIAIGEIVDASLGANEVAARKAYAAAFVAEHLFGSALGSDALPAIAEALLEPAVGSGAGLAQLEGRLGLVQARVATADDRLSADADRMRALVTETHGVDPFEAAQRFQSSVTQLETAYALTGRLSQLSLMRFL